MPSKLEARVAQHDREIAAIRKLILTGMRMINSLAASQRKTDRMLQDLISSLRGGAGGSNGHSSKRPRGL